MEIRLSVDGYLRWDASRYRWTVDGAALELLPELVVQERYARASGEYAKISITITTIEPILDAEETCEPE